MRCFVNLPLSYILDAPDYLQFFARNKLHPELGADVRGTDIPDKDWHQRTAQVLRDAGLSCAMHLPFLDLHPGSHDGIIRRASQQRLQKAVELAAIYHPAHLIGHACFQNALHTADPDAWIERSLKTWTALAHTAEETDHELPPLYLENTYERAPEPVLNLATALNQELDTPVGICFDAGHWHSFAKGHANQDLPRWVDTFAPLLKHLHLHDNDGTGDQHIGLGQGSIPWRDLETLLHKHSLTPTATLEPHTEQDFRHTTTFLTRHPDFLGWLREGE